MYEDNSLVCHVDLEKAFGRVKRKVLEWVVQKRIPNVLGRAVIIVMVDVTDLVRGGCVK